MPVNARADSSGVRLVIAMEGGWTLILRRADFSPDTALSRYFGREMRPGDLESFLPNWAGLTWTKLPRGFFYGLEGSAQDGQYFVSLHGGADGPGDFQKLVEAFQDFMKG